MPDQADRHRAAVGEGDEPDGDGERPLFSKLNSITFHGVIFIFRYVVNLLIVILEYCRYDIMIRI